MTRDCVSGKFGLRVQFILLTESAENVALRNIFAIFDSIYPICLFPVCEKSALIKNVHLQNTYYMTQPTTTYFRISQTFCHLIVKLLIGTYTLDKISMTQNEPFLEKQVDWKSVFIYRLGNLFIKCSKYKQDDIATSITWYITLR